MTRDQIIQHLIEKYGEYDEFPVSNGPNAIIYTSDLSELLHEYDRLVVENFGERLSNET